MQLKQILKLLDSSPYKFTLANKLRDRVRSLPEDKRIEVVRDVRLEIARNNDSNIYKPLMAVIDGIRDA